MPTFSTWASLMVHLPCLLSCPHSLPPSLPPSLSLSLSLALSLAVSMHEHMHYASMYMWGCRGNKEELTPLVQGRDQL